MIFEIYKDVYTASLPVGEIAHWLFSVRDNEKHSRLQNYAFLDFQATFRKVLKKMI